MCVSYFREIRCEGVDWIHVAQEKDPVADSCVHGNESLGYMKGRAFAWPSERLLASEGLFSLDLVMHRDVAQKKMKCIATDHDWSRSWGRLASLTPLTLI
jgi:hypothetical protein